MKTPNSGLAFFLRSSTLSTLITALCGFFLNACYLPDSTINQFNEHIGPIFHIRLSQEKSLTTQKGNTSEASSEESSEADSNRQRIHMEFIKELHEIVLNRKASDEEYTRWMNVINQGGSYEGIYNGVVLSEEYAQKEKGTAPPQSVRLYAELMTNIRTEEKYDPKSVRQSEEEAKMLGLGPTDAPKKESNEEEQKVLLSEYAKTASNKSLATLKREVAMEILKLFEMKREYKEKLATWFGRFVMLTNSKKVNFGIAERNSGDETFHYKWALQNSEDRIRWEAINRVHRLFNEQNTDAPKN